MLGVTRDDLAAPEHRGGVLRFTGRASHTRRGLRGRIEVADDDGDLATPLLGQPAGQGHQRPLARGDEGPAQDEVLRRIAGQREFTEGDQMSAVGDGPFRPGTDQVGVTSEIPDGRVHLGEGDPQLGHGCSVGGRGVGR